LDQTNSSMHLKPYTAKENYIKFSFPPYIINSLELNTEKIQKEFNIHSKPSKKLDYLDWKISQSLKKGMKPINRFNFFHEGIQNIWTWNHSDSFIEWETIKLVIENIQTQKQEVDLKLYFSEAQVLEVKIWTKNKKDSKVETYLQWNCLIINNM